MLRWYVLAFLAFCHAADPAGSSQAGAVVIQGSCSWLLSATSSKVDSAKSVVTLFLILSFLQLALVTFWWRQIQNREDLAAYGLLPPEDSAQGSIHADGFAGQDPSLEKPGSKSDQETMRGRFAMGATAVLVLTSWGVFAYNYWRKG